MTVPLGAWRVLTAVAAVTLYAIAVSDTAYELTSPASLSHHVLLRKVYALVAFTVLGWLLAKARLPRAAGLAAGGMAIALYSCAVEIGQIAIDHSPETFAQHGFDVASGLFGGMLGAVVAELARPGGGWNRRGAGAVVVLLGLIAASFAPIYGQVDRPPGGPGEGAASPQGQNLTTAP